MTCLQLFEIRNTKRKSKNGKKSKGNADECLPFKAQRKKRRIKLSFFIWFIWKNTTQKRRHGTTQGGRSKRVRCFVVPENDISQTQTSKVIYFRNGSIYRWKALKTKEEKQKLSDCGTMKWNRWDVSLFESCYRNFLRNMFYEKILLTQRLRNVFRKAQGAC